jgi:hypothetical protein
MKSSVHSLIPFLALILPILKTRLHSIPLLPSSYLYRLASRGSTLHLRLLLLLYSVAFSVSSYISSAQTTENTASIVKEVCLLVRCLAMGVLLLLAYSSRECVYQVGA